MSIESEITRINNNIAATYTALSAKGATMPATENSANLASTVATVPSGGSVDPSRLLFEVNDGVASKPSVALDENTFAGVTRIGSSVLSSSYNRSVVSGVVSFPDLTTVDSNGLNAAFRGSSVTKAMFPVLTLAQVNSFYNTFNGCTYLTEASFPELTDLTNGSFSNAFGGSKNLLTLTFTKLEKIQSTAFDQGCRGCTSLTSISFPALTWIESSSCKNAFENCSSLTSISFTELTNIENSGFYGAFKSCTSLTTVDFPKLNTVDYYGFYEAFKSCTSLTTISFPSLTTVNTSAMFYCFSGCTNLTEIHFPAAIQATIEGLSSYSSKFGASNATIYFDL